MQYTERMKLALNYAEESSKRTRWIIFMMQLAVVLVVATIWQQTDSNWTFSRLRSAQNLVRVLTCKPENIYGKVATTSAMPLPVVTNATSSPFTSDYADSQYRCNMGLTDEEIAQALDYEKTWHFSLVEAKKNVADLQQLVASRALSINVPVLGLNFDVNDLDVMAGFTFVILLSWLHFALRRQHRNIQHVFNLAKKAEDPVEQDETRRLRIAYNLLAMTQVLTVPPASHEDLKGSPVKRWAQPSSLIIWTAVLAQLLIVIDDFLTLPLAATLSNRITWIETGAASILLIYMIVRTVLCSKAMRDTYAVWDQAFRDAHPLAPVTSPPLSPPAQTMP